MINLKKQKKGFLNKQYLLFKIVILSYLYYYDSTI